MKKKKRVGWITKIVVAIFAVYAAVTLVSLQMSINAKKQEQARLTQDLENQRLVNAELEDIIGEERNEEYIAKIARDSLDYVYPGERVFVDVSSK